MPDELKQLDAEFLASRKLLIIAGATTSAIKAFTNAYEAGLDSTERWDRIEDCDHSSHILICRKERHNER